ncbi:hypothetical protein OS493_037000 [Desmophyllum pertusum]|uniref:SWIM-type domain-containing protein n=1 Tax=Desmophyllum pertusum TaxID=174260 RepID=A0A9X0CPR5_9CNID|nr:hypothetical protein OS493_037000 [Desmophyllum pertusum]
MKIILCHVHHSMKSDLPLQVFVRIGKVSGFIQQVSCTCKARELNRCCHVAAVLLMLSDYVSDNGHVVVKPSTSQPCKWNKGKKRTKDPKALHKSSYKSSKKSSSSAMYNWDPRPVEFQNKVDQDGVHTFHRNLQAYSATQGTLSMWETLLQINYQDFKLDDADVVHYKSLVTEFETALADSLSSISDKFTVGQIPNTESQSKSEEWCQARWCRITAFRETYSELHESRSLANFVNMLALTATTTSSTRKTITDILMMEKPHVMYESPSKMNIAYSVHYMKNERSVEDHFQW